MKSEAIIGAVESVTKAWAKQRKAEERNSRAIARRRHYSTRVNFTDVAATILPKAYEHASGGGQYTVSKRQLYYASRDAFREATGRDIEANYFSQTLLVQYLNRHPNDWKVTSDPRGTLVIPNTNHEVRIPVGTIAIDKYLMDRLCVDPHDFGNLPTRWPSTAEKQRYAGVLYIEKEGFEPVLQEARIAERFDLAIISCKGQSVVAARKLVDHVCAVGDGVPLFIVHDFDKSGFEIAECLTKESQSACEQDRVQYSFRNEINAIDFGLRLKDVEEYDLASESCSVRGERFPGSMTEDEIEFMETGRRVELNAFTAPQLVEWLENKLGEHLPERLLPDDDILRQAYQRGVVIKRINDAIDSIVEDASETGEALVPDSFRDEVKAEMARTGEPWDVALYSLIDVDD